jgi:hypothetical protein
MHRELLSTPHSLIVVDEGSHVVRRVRTGARFESLDRRHGAGLYASFRKVAVLVHSAAGRLQVRRFLDVTRPDAAVFTDERDASAFLAG